MKRKIGLLLCALLCTIQMYAQKQVTTFLGIPVDGTREEMMTKLKAKGFKQIDSETLTGTFNGEDVQLSILTYKDKVWRIAVLFTAGRNQQQIRVHYNRLINQFKNNGRYMVSDAELLAEDEDISYQIDVKNKSYEAIFYQLSVEENVLNRGLASLRQAWFCILKSESYGKSVYRIRLFYDNKFNEAQGEDL